MIFDWAKVAYVCSMELSNLDNDDFFDFEDVFDFEDDVSDDDTLEEEDFRSDDDESFYRSLADY